MLGAALAPLAPICWVLISLLIETDPWATLANEMGVLTYMLFGTLLVFVVFGYRMGQLEQQAIDDSMHDALTGLPNRAFFDRRLGQLLAVVRREPMKRFSLITLDIDHFKRINDRYGHGCGDLVLQKLSASLSQVLRKGETLARVGGEEFALIAEDSDLGQGFELAERLRVVAEAIDYAACRVPDETITVSFGVCSSESGTTAEELLLQADQALYQAKRTGRNKVCSVVDGQFSSPEMA